MTTLILPAEYIGTVTPPGNQLTIGTPPDHVTVDTSYFPGGVSVYVRRRSDTLAVIEIAMASHDGLDQEELDHQNAEAARYPLGPREYWRAHLVGKATYGIDQHLMTEAEFAADWEEGELS